MPFMLNEQVEKINGRLMTIAPEIFGKPPILFAYLYGSYARGFVHPFSEYTVERMGNIREIFKWLKTMFK